MDPRFLSNISDSAYGLVVGVVSSECRCEIYILASFQMVRRWLCNGKKNYLSSRSGGIEGPNCAFVQLNLCIRTCRKWYAYLWKITYLWKFVISSPHAVYRTFYKGSNFRSFHGLDQWNYHDCTMYYNRHNHKVSTIQPRPIDEAKSIVNNSRFACYVACELWDKSLPRSTIVLHKTLGTSTLSSILHVQIFRLVVYTAGGSHGSKHISATQDLE